MLADDACKKIVFVARYGLFKYTVLPLGLCYAPYTFQFLMNMETSGYIDDFIIAYLNDILVYSSNVEQYKAHLRKVFDRLRKHKLQAKLNKCKF